MISIVIPLYNKAAVICRTMESVKQQIFSDFEILIVNDGSTDDSLSVLMDFLSENEAVFKNSVRLIEQENKGVSAARNQGIKEARGEIIAFLDADDEWLPDYLKTIAFLVEKYPECDIFGTAYSFKMNKKEKRIALLSALSSKVAESKIVVLDEFKLDEIKTKKFVEVMNNLKVENALVVLEGENKNVVLSGRNIPSVKVTATNEINTYDVLKYTTLVVTKAAVEKLEEVYA